eukprot:7455771-Karenia_brevis.AAC.1
MKKKRPSAQPAGQNFALATTRRAEQDPFQLVCLTTETPRKHNFQDARCGGTGYSRRITSL